MADIEGEARSDPAVAVLAVDGGASKTDVVLVAADGTVLGRARGGPSNHQMVGLEAAMENLAATVAQAAAETGVVLAADQPLCRVGSYCLAGVDLPIDEVHLGEALRAAGWSSEVGLVNDTFAILRAGVRGGWGVAVVCGTGLNCVGLGPDGTMVRYPSLGELSGDFTPGGAWLGVRGLGLALRAGQGRGRPGPLRAAVAQHFGLADPEAVLEAVYTGDLSYARLPELAEVVLGATAAGDPDATGAAEQLADEVVLMVVAAIGRLGVTDGPVEVVAGGGIFDDEWFAARVTGGVQAQVPGAQMRRLSVPPVVGAALLGLDAFGAAPAARARLRQDLV